MTAPKVLRSYFKSVVDRESNDKNAIQIQNVNFDPTQNKAELLMASRLNRFSNNFDVFHNTKLSKFTIPKYETAKIKHQSLQQSYERTF